jgi:hypothetical protein
VSAPCAEEVRLALAAAVRLLLAGQSSDGSWRSDVYGAFKDGGSLTPLVLRTLLAVPAGKDVRASIGRGLAYLADLAGVGNIEPGPFGLSYPVYTAALAVEVLSHAAGATHTAARDAWLSYLCRRQLTEALGWRPADREHGGWGYAAGLPRKPAPEEPAPPYTESNLSATLFAVEALRAAGCPADDPALARALVFVGRCQNHADEPDPAFDDGGFFFIYDDPVRNKAGVAGTDRAGRTRYASYGSATADGLRALVACGLPPGHGRVTAARRWLERHFATDRHPGAFAAGRRAIRDSVYYYFCNSLARALQACGAAEVATPAGPVGWAEALAGELLRRQRPDGSWVNDAVEVREDDPLVATALAAGALALSARRLR